MQERTNVYLGEFSPTGIETGFCPRRFYYSKILGLTSVYPPLALFFGSAVHKGVETFYKHKNDLSLDELTPLVIELASKDWLQNEVEGDDKRNIDSLITVLGNYCDYYKNDQANILPQFVEAMQWVEMPNGTSMLAKIDRVRQDSNIRTVVDTKTSSWPLTDFFFKGFENNFQTSMYYHVVREVIGEVDQIQIDGIKIPPPPSSSKSVPFARRSFTRTELQMEDAINTYCKVTDHIMEGVNEYADKGDEEKLIKHMYCNQSKCNDYGGCPYLPICKHGFDHPTVQVDFIRKPVVKPNGEIE